MTTSPDHFHSVRDNVAELKASNESLQLMELKAHLLMLNDYDEQILSHYLDLENEYKPLPQLIAQQPEIRLKMRYLVIDYLLDIVNKFKLSTETFFTTIHVIDRYSSVRIIKKSQYQLVGLCCLWISSKFHEKKQNVPTLDDLTKLCCNCYSKKLFINMETHILSSVGWCISSNLESTLDVLIQKSKLYNLLNVKLASLYICQLAQFSKLSLNFKNSQITCAALSLTLRALNGYQAEMNELEMALLKIISKPHPSSMIDQSLHTAVVELKRFYQYRDIEEEQDKYTTQFPQNVKDRQELQLLTPPNSASGSIDAGVKYAPITPLLYLNNQIDGGMQPSVTGSTSINPSQTNIYPSPIEAVTPSVNFNVKRNYDAIEADCIPSFKKIRYGTEETDYFYEF